MSEESASEKDILLFGKWRFDEVEVADLGLQRYISLKPVLIPHSGGRYQDQRFKKSEMNIVERFVNKIMRTGRNAGKKQRAINIVKVAFEIINLRTGKNPIQVLVDAVTYSAPREETTRITWGGVAQHSSVDIAPQRRVDLALRYLSEAIKQKSFNNIKSVDEVVAEELIMAANNDQNSAAVKKKAEVERIALSAR
ncbi:MAG: 30S ribosomal protein S7 [Candidatus Heimdallarchaeaceae archaeon]